MNQLPLRFASRIEAVTESGCWLWLGGMMTNGYGVYSRPYVGRRSALAHRFAYETLIGTIPPYLQLDHLCRVRSCVNPAHLEPVTRRENILRGEAPSAVCARRTHCPKGHAYSNENVIMDSGHRRCLICRMAYEHARNLRRYIPKRGRVKRNVKTGRSANETQRRVILQAELG